MGVPTNITLQDYLEIQNLASEWADTYDAKDWDRLKSILGTAIHLDFRPLKGSLHENLTPDEYAAIIADKKVIGDPRVKTQHLIGAGRWNDPGDGTVQIWWQARVAHQRYDTENLVKAINSGVGHGAVQHTYQKIQGSWRIVGIKVKIDWIEGDLFGTLHPPEEHPA